jgi:succinate dehydrogenase/fumarate reductase flavoprotein subunit
MQDEENMELTVDRRGFLTGAAALLAGGATTLVGCTTEQPTAGGSTRVGVPDTWDEEVDIVIVGLGAAGVSGALAADIAGADVLVIEAAPREYRGGNFRVSGGGWVAPWDVDVYYEHLQKLCRGATPDEYLRDWAEANTQILPWMDTLGFDYEIDVHNYGHYFTEQTAPGIVTSEDSDETQQFGTLQSGIDRYINYDSDGKIVTGGYGAFQLFADVYDERGIRTLYETRGRKLFQDPVTREVLGVVATDTAGKEINIKARKGVVLACGGFENDPALIDSCVLPGVRIYPSGTPYNVGDGLMMGLAAGADPYHLNGIEWVGYGIRPTDSDCATFSEFRNLNAGIVVNKYGVRIYNEDKKLYHTKEFPAIIFKGFADDTEALNDYYGLPSFVVFDETRRLEGPGSFFTVQATAADNTTGFICAYKLYEWSADNSKEIANGIIKKGNTIAELAGTIGIDVTELEATITRWNGFAEKGVDEDFGRGANHMKPIATPPFYGIELVPVFINTQGGLKHSNKDGRVLDRDNNVIPRLYAAGECGSVYSLMYHGSGNNAEAIVVGKLAAEDAAALEPWG